MSRFTVILTDECNYDCAYCYQKKRNRRLEVSSLFKALDFFLPLFASECCISFYGGEPLLAFDVLKRAVEHVEGLSAKRHLQHRYSLTTNGSLLTDDILGFLEGHEFSLILSFDGLAQDHSRMEGSFDLLASLIPRILARPRINLETNSVFSAETVDYLSESVEYIVETGVRKLDVNFSKTPPWTGASLLRLGEEIVRVRRYFESRYERPQDVPWTYFYEELERAIHHCSAGLSQMALSADGVVWGCFVFPHYFTNKEGTEEYDKYCFGEVDSFIANPQEIYAHKIVNYSDLRMDRFSTPDRACLMCAEIETCWLCPLAAGLTTGEIGKIPASSCHAAKAIRKERRRLLEHFSKEAQGPKEPSDG